MKNASGPQDFNEQGFQWKFFIGPPGHEPSSVNLRVSACTTAWALFNGYSPSLVQKCMKDLKRGDQSVNIFDQRNESNHELLISNPELMPELFARRGRRDGKEIIAKNWLHHKLKTESCIMPTVQENKNKMRRLPFFDLTSAWMIFNEEQRQVSPGFKCSYSAFRRAKQSDPILKAASFRRLTGLLAKCSVCDMYVTELKRCQQHDVTREEVWLKYKGHLILAALERRSYYDRRYLALKYPREYISCIIDSSTQHYHKCPSLAKFLKNDVEYSYLQQSLTCVHFHGQRTFLFPRMPFHDKGSNWSLQCLSFALQELAKSKIYSSSEQGLPKTIFVQMDNCAGDNKNKFVFGYFASLVANGTFDTVVVSFLLVGHTHEDVDQIFSIIAKKLRKHASITLTEFDKLLRKALKKAARKRVRVHRFPGTMDFRSWVNPCVDSELAGYSVPCTFVFECDSSSGTRVAVMKYKSFWCSETWFPKPGPSADAANDLYREAEGKAEETRQRGLEAIHEEAAKHTGDFLSSTGRRQQPDDMSSSSGGSSVDFSDCTTSGDDSSDSEVTEHEGSTEKAPDSDDIDCKEGLRDNERDGFKMLAEVAKFKKLKAGSKPGLSDSMLVGRGFLQFETPDSVNSFFRSPGIRPLRVNPIFDDLEVAEPNDKENNLLAQYRQKVDIFVGKPFEDHSEKHTEDDRMNAQEEWKKFFDAWPRSVSDLQLEPIDWNGIRSLAQGRQPRQREAVVAVPMGEMFGEKIIFDKLSQIKFSGHLDIEMENQLHAELRAAMAVRPIAANSFVLLWKDSASSRSDRFVDTLPFSLAKVLKACEVPSPGQQATLEVSYWVCPSGDPNKVFQQGVDEAGHEWRDTVPRESVLLCDVEFAASEAKKGSAISKYLNRERTLKPLTQLGRLPGWCMETGYGMVYHDPEVC